MATVRIKRDDLVQALDSVYAGVSSKGSLDQGDCFVFTDGKVKTFSEEVSCSAPSPLGKMEAVVKAKSLKDILAKMGDEELDVVEKNGELIFRAGRKKVSVVRDTECRLPFDLVDTPGKWQPLHEDFSDAVNVVGKCCASTYEGDNNPVSVRIHPRWLEACDGYQVCRWELKTGVKTPFLVHHSALRAMVPLGMTEFSLSEGWIHFRNRHGQSISCHRLQEEDWSELDEFFDVKGKEMSLPKSLIKAAERAEIFAAEIAEDIQILVTLSSGQVVVEGRGVSGRYEESPKIKYTGPKLSFLIRPQMLKDLVDKHSECLVSSTRLKVDAGRYQYVCCLRPPEEGLEEVEEVKEEDSDGGEDE